MGHNIDFELDFINAELVGAGFSGLNELAPAGIIDTLKLATEKLPQQGHTPDDIIEYYRPETTLPGDGAVAMAHRVAMVFGLLSES